jgi:iron-only hydrogenase group A
MMVFNIEVNNRAVQAEQGESILSALTRAGIHVPTLCSMKDLSPTGACRMCIVEVQGKSSLVPSCSFIVEDKMQIKTHSPRVVRARKTLIELLLSNHPDDCLYCERSGNCELQNLAAELNVRERRIPGIKNFYKIDKSSAGIVREPAKCILCGRCVRVCEELQSVAAVDFLERGSQTHIGTAFNKDLNFSSCIQCGQCLMVCPTAALTEKVQFPDLEVHLHNPGKKVLVQYSPVTAFTVAEAFGLKTGKETTGLIHAALKKIGFDLVYDSSFGNDVQVVEMANELIHRVEADKLLPLISSCCPSWVKYAEQFRPEILPNLSTCKSAQQIMGSLMKTFLSACDGDDARQPYSVSVMPCLSKKYESQRAEMTNMGLSDIDTVITTRELIRLIRLNGINMENIQPETPDEKLSAASSIGTLMGASGGLTEAIIRSLHFLTTGTELKEYSIQKLRGNKERRELKLKIADEEYGFAVVNGLSGIHSLLNEIANGRSDIHFIEVMACRGGCVYGGGQPITNPQNENKSRIKSLYEMDERAAIRTAHKNPGLKELYANFPGEPLVNKSLSLLHTGFSKKDVLL